MSLISRNVRFHKECAIQKHLFGQSRRLTLSHHASMSSILSSKETWKISPRSTVSVICDSEVEIQIVLMSPSLANSSGYALMFSRDIITILLELTGSTPFLMQYAVCWGFSRGYPGGQRQLDRIRSAGNTPE